MVHVSYERVKAQSCTLIHVRHNISIFMNRFGELTRTLSRRKYFNDVR